MWGNIDDLTGRHINPGGTMIDRLRQTGRTMRMMSLALAIAQHERPCCFVVFNDRAEAECTMDACMVWFPQWSPEIQMSRKGQAIITGGRKAIYFCTLDDVVERSRGFRSFVLFDHNCTRRAIGEARSRTGLVHIETQ